MQPEKKKLLRIRDVPDIILKIAGVTRSKETVYLWARNGVIGYAGDKLKLKTVRRAGHLFTTREWVEDFIRRM